MNQALRDVIEHREHRIYELRVYRVVQGRMADLLKRFEHQTLPIMARHGFLQAGFWTTIVGRSEQRLSSEPTTKSAAHSVIWRK
jgi:short subunit dehydrogenase-like uncharacterized protein